MEEKGSSFEKNLASSWKNGVHAPGSWLLALGSYYTEQCYIFKSKLLIKRKIWGFFMKKTAAHLHYFTSFLNI